MPERVPTLARNFGSWIVSRLFALRLIAEVQPEDDRCEFGCRETDCRLDRWAHCENRLKHLARLTQAGGAEGAPSAKP
jgi:hypothetical protein